MKGSSCITPERVTGGLPNLTPTYENMAGAVYLIDFCFGGFFSLFLWGEGEGGVVGFVCVVLFIFFLFFFFFVHIFGGCFLILQCKLLKVIQVCSITNKCHIKLVSRSIIDTFYIS